MNQHGIMSIAKRLLKVAIVGAPNAGKSTLLNRLVVSDISCVSNKVHTTRSNVLASYTEGDTQLEFYDSPGLVTREHVLKHRLEDSLAVDPNKAAEKCDLIAVVIDVANPRERRKLNKGLVRMLNNCHDKSSFLIMNKVDLLKDKRQLLEIGAKLSEGHLENKPVLPKHQLEDITRTKNYREIKTSGKYLIELDEQSSLKSSMVDDSSPIGFKNFSRIFSISALNDDGVDELRSAMIERAQPVNEWPHGPDFVCPMNHQDIVISIIKGKVMDYTDHQIPYVVRYKFLQYAYDELGSMHVHLELKVPNRYMVGKLIGEHGSIIFKIINESREKVQTVLGLDVKLNIVVNSEREH